MKNKRLTYILIPATLLLWVFIILRIINYQSDGEPYSPAGAVVQKDIESIKSDTFSLLLDYPDPFLKAQATYSNNTGSKAKTDIPDKEKIPLPGIKYFGIVINQESGLMQINLQIEGKNYLMSRGDRVDEVQLEEVYGDSIRITYHEQTHTISK